MGAYDHLEGHDPDGEQAADSPEPEPKSDPKPDPKGSSGK